MSGRTTGLLRRVAARFTGFRTDTSNFDYVEDAVSRGGVISGEHGIGLLKREYLRRTADPAVLELMRAVKRALDPGGTLNPGKILG